MSKERTIITQELCDHVKALLAGGLTNAQTAKFAKVGEATVVRIKAAGFNAVQYAADTDRRRIRANDRKADKAIEKLKQEGRLPEAGGGIDYEALQAGNKQSEMPNQMYMWIPEGEDKPEVLVDESKMMRFYAGQTDKIVKEINGLRNQVTGIYEMLGQILRRKDV